MRIYKYSQGIVLPGCFQFMKVYITLLHRFSEVTGIDTDLIFKNPAEIKPVSVTN